MSMNMDDGCAVMDDDLAVPPPTRPPRTRSLSESGGTPAKLSPSPLIVRTTAKDDSSLSELASPYTSDHHPRRPVSLGLQLSMGGGLGTISSPDYVQDPSFGMPSSPAFGMASSPAFGMASSPAFDRALVQSLPGGWQEQPRTQRIQLPQLPPYSLHQLPHPNNSASTTQGAPPTTLGTSNAFSSTVTAAATTASPWAKPFPPTPSSPKLPDTDDPYRHLHLPAYTSPTNILPRRSRGLDFSRAATNLHHSILADQSSPDSSPTVAIRRGMAISGRRTGDFGSGPADQSCSLWSVMGNGGHDRPRGSTASVTSHLMNTDSSDSSDDDDIMDEDHDEPYVSTPQAQRIALSTAVSPAGNNLLSYQQRRRHKKQPQKRLRGPIGLGFSTAAAAATSISRSPPASGHGWRRDSVSNRMPLTGSDGEEGLRQPDEGAPGTPPSREGRNSVIRRVVTRRGNLLPKTKNFARIRAALAEEGAPIESEFRREAEVVRQVRESDVGVDAPVTRSAEATALSSPNLAARQEDAPLDDVPEVDMMSTDVAMNLSAVLRQRALRNPRAKMYLDNFSDTSSSNGATGRTTPPAALNLGRHESSEDMAVDQSTGIVTDILHRSATAGIATTTIITTNKRRREDDDFDPVGFKRRAVSPSVSSVHGSPIAQSPMSRDAPWGARANSTGGGSVNGSTAGSVKGRVGYQGMVDTSDGLCRMAIE